MTTPRAGNKSDMTSATVLDRPRARAVPLPARAVRAMAEPTNTDLLVALSRLDEKVVGLTAHLERSVERHGREISDLRSEVRELASDMKGPDGIERRLTRVENAPTVTWLRLGALLAVLLPTISLIVAIFTVR